MTGNRDIAADAAVAAVAGTRTDRPPNALATSAIDTSPVTSDVVRTRLHRSGGRQCDRGRDVVVVDELQGKTRIRHDRLQHRHRLCHRARTGPGSRFHRIAFANAGAWGPATMHGRSTKTSNDESLVMSASTASHAALCPE